MDVVPPQQHGRRLPRRTGCRTATTRSSGNVSSLCRYETGARRRARSAPLSVGTRASGRFWPVGAVCGHAGQRRQESRGPAQRRSARESGWLFFSTDSHQERPPHNATPTAQRRVEVLESSCASHVRTRTTPLRPYFSSATTAADLHSAAHHVLDPLSVTR